MERENNNIDIPLRGSIKNVQEKLQDNYCLVLKLLYHILIYKCPIDRDLENAINEK